jgi:pyruvate formate lyase activating enzyme
MITLFRESEGKLECLVCPHYCKLGIGKTGICGVRKNTGEKIDLITYNVLSGYAVDPVEKKPLFHFFPGHSILSIGSFGCNMRCDFCQNYHISQNIPKSIVSDVKIDKIIDDALSIENNIGIAFTYNEPIIWFEFIRDVAVTAKEKGLHTVVVSNGYVNSEPLGEIISFTDAFNIDLKAFNNTFYRHLTGSELEPVKSSLKQVARSGKHLEVTTLIIPGQNDDEKEMAQQTEWIANELGNETPFHLSRYHPNYKRESPSTPEVSLKRLFDIASKNLKHVYMGNTASDEGQNTSCQVCGTVVTTRSGYRTRIMNLDEKGNCLSCGNQVYKNFSFS